jgi:hypothetical protein
VQRKEKQYEEEKNGRNYNKGTHLKVHTPTLQNNQKGEKKGMF